MALVALFNYFKYPDLADEPSFDPSQDENIFLIGRIRHKVKEILSGFVEASGYQSILRSFRGQFQKTPSIIRIRECFRRALSLNLGPLNLQSLILSLEKENPSFHNEEPFYLKAILKIIGEEYSIEQLIPVVGEVKAICIQKINDFIIQTFNNFLENISTGPINSLSFRTLNQLQSYLIHNFTFCQITIDELRDIFRELLFQRQPELRYYFDPDKLWVLLLVRRNCESCEVIDKADFVARISILHSIFYDQPFKESVLVGAALHFVGRLLAKRRPACFSEERKIIDLIYKDPTISVDEVISSFKELDPKTVEAFATLWLRNCDLIYLFISVPPIQNQEELITLFRLCHEAGGQMTHHEIISDAVALFKLNYEDVDVIYRIWWFSQTQNYTPLQLCLKWCEVELGKDNTPENAKELFYEKFPDLPFSRAS